MTPRQKYFRFSSLPVSLLKPSHYPPPPPIKSPSPVFVLVASGVPCIVPVLANSVAATIIFGHHGIFYISLVCKAWVASTKWQVVYNNNSNNKNVKSFFQNPGTRIQSIFCVGLHSHGRTNLHTKYGKFCQAWQATKFGDLVFPNIKTFQICQCIQTLNNLQRNQLLLHICIVENVSDTTDQNNWAPFTRNHCNLKQQNVLHTFFLFFPFHSLWFCLLQVLTTSVVSNGRGSPSCWSCSESGTVSAAWSAPPGSQSSGFCWRKDLRTWRKRRKW